MAAMELGGKGLALWDLLLASKIDPLNKEIRAKLDEINCSTSQKRQDDQCQDMPTGLGLCVPPMKKKKRESFMIQNGKKDLIEGAAIIGRNCSSVEANTSNSANDNKDEAMEDCVSVADSEQAMVNKLSKTDEGGALYRTMNEVHDVVVEDVLQSFTIEKSNLAELTYRFVNRRKANSYIYFRGEIYQKLRVRKSVDYVNSKSRSFMTVRMVPMPTLSSQRDVKVKKMDIVDATYTTFSEQEKCTKEVHMKEVSSIPKEGMGVEKSKYKLLEESADSKRSSSIVEVKENYPVYSPTPTQFNPQIILRKNRKS